MIIQNNTGEKGESIGTLLPSAYGKMDAILKGDTSLEDILDVSFGSKQTRHRMD